jgi:hypothetical protein
MSSFKLIISKDKSFKQDYKVLSEKKADNKQATTMVKPVWKMEQPASPTSSSLPEEAWPAPVPKQAGHPTLGLSLSGKKKAGPS